MLKNKFSKLIAPILLIVLLTSCSPSAVEVGIYTTDIDVAQEGEVIEVPVMASFSLYSDDDGELESASQIAEKYLAPDSIFLNHQGIRERHLLLKQLSQWELLIVYKTI